MLKNILKLEETQELNKKEQGKITGGLAVFDCSGEADGTPCLGINSGRILECFEGVCYDC